MYKNRLSFAEIFIWATTILGFAVDSIAIAAYLPNFRFSNTSIELPSVPKVSVGTVDIRWQDLSLVILIYTFLGILLLIRKNVNKFRNVHRAVFSILHFWTALALLWLFVFYFRGYFFIQLISWWLFTQLAILRFSEDKNNIIHLIGFYIFIFPIWSYLDSILEAIPWSWSTGVVLNLELFSLGYLAISLIFLVAAVRIKV